MKQPTLFDDAPTPTTAARRRDPITSVLAAERAEQSGTAADHRSRVLAYVRHNPGQTSAEIAQGMGMQRQAPARRLPELAKAGLVYRGHGRTCLVAGTLAITWWPVRDET